MIGIAMTFTVLIFGYSCSAIGAGFCCASLEWILENLCPFLGVQTALQKPLCPNYNIHGQKGAVGGKDFCFCSSWFQTVIHKSLDLFIKYIKMCFFLVTVFHFFLHCKKIRALICEPHVWPYGRSLPLSPEYFEYSSAIKIPLSYSHFSTNKTTVYMYFHVQFSLSILYNIYWPIHKTYPPTCISTQMAFHCTCCIDKSGRKKKKTAKKDCCTN